LISLWKKVQLSRDPHPALAATGIRKTTPIVDAGDLG
jgi:hypothetical protein